VTRIDDLITDIIEREGGATATNDPKDAGGRTQYGISERSNPDAWKDGKVTEAEARQIYLQKYVVGPGFDKIVDSQLQAQLVDYGVHSGPAIAIQKLQSAIGVAVDGKLGPATLQALEQLDPRIINNRLVAARIKMIGQIVVKVPSQLKYLNGFLNRALEFL